MSTALLIISLVSAMFLLISFLVSRCKITKQWNRISYGISIISFLALVTSGVLSYLTNIEVEDQLQLARDQASEASVNANIAQTQITELRTPRRMEPETKRMLVARVQPFAGQKYDMQVFRDVDSLELAMTLQSILEAAGWLHTNVYPKYATNYPETREDGLFTISGKAETEMTSEARMALHGALNEAGLYDDSTHFSSVSCVEITEPVQEGSRVTRIPCSESQVQITEIHSQAYDDVIPKDTLVLHIGKNRL